MAKKEQPSVNTDAWMNTYADLVTLLLTFFVLLYSMSSVDAEKFERFVTALTNPGDKTSQVVFDSNAADGQALAVQGGENPPSGDVDIDTPEELSDLPINFEDLYKYLQAYTEENNMQSSVQVSKQADNAVFIRFQSNMVFDPDEYTLRPQSYDVLGFMGDCLKNVEGQILTININGHTAAVPNSETYTVSDWMLSSERASQIAIYFEEEKGIDPMILRPMGYGKNYPVDSNDTIEGRERNRRVDMVIISKESDIAKDGQMYKEFTGLFDPAEFPKEGGVQDIIVPRDSEESSSATTSTSVAGGEASAASDASVAETVADETPEPSEPESLPPILPPS